MPRTKARAPHAGQILHDLQGVALCAGNLAGLLGADAGLNRLLLDPGRTHDDLLVDVILFLFHVVLHGALLTWPDGFVGQHRDKPGVADLDLVGGGRQIGEGEGSSRIGLGGQIQILDPHRHVGQWLLLESIQNHAREVHLGAQRHHLGRDGEVVSVGDLDGNGLPCCLCRGEEKLTGSGNRSAVEIGTAALDNLNAADLAVLPDIE